MKNEKILKEWKEFAKMDFLTAKHLVGIMENVHPKRKLILVSRYMRLLL